MRLLAVMLTVLWAVTAIVIAVAYRPGGPVDIAVALACFIPVVIACLLYTSDAADECVNV